MDHAEGSKGEEDGGPGEMKDDTSRGPMSPPPAVGGVAGMDDKETSEDDSVMPGTSSSGSEREGSRKETKASGCAPTLLKGRRNSPTCISRSSSSPSTSQLSSASSKPHAYLASSEEESEAELDDASHCSSHSEQTTLSRTLAYKRMKPISKKKQPKRVKDKPAFEITTNGAASKAAVSSGVSAAVAAAIPRVLRTSVGEEMVSKRAAQTSGPLVESSGDGAGPASQDVKRPHRPLTAQLVAPPAPASTSTRTRHHHRHHHLPLALPTFREPRTSMWTSTHDANAPSEDRYSSLVNVLLRPPKSNRGPARNNGMSSSGSSGSSSSGDEGTEVIDPPPDNDEEEDNTSLIRMSLWSVIDGHGGGCVATYASEVLLPHIAACVARALKCEIVDRGVCMVNGQLRDANALDLDGLIRSSDRSKMDGKAREAGIDVVNPNSIHYRSPEEDSESEGEGIDHAALEMAGEQDSIAPDESEPPVSVASSLLPRNPPPDSVSSVKTSVKTAVSPATQHAPIGTHSPAEVADITKAIAHSFLSVDEGWINSIDPVTTHQTSCVSNGRWNAGACALVVFTIQRLDWTRSSMADPETECEGRGAGAGEDTSHNKDAARRRKLDYATKSKSVSSLSTLSSTSSLATVAPPTAVSVQESEITETEDDDDVSDIFGPRRRNRGRGARDDPHHQGGVVVSTPGGCKCHYYRPHDAMLYTAHVGDCRAVMLGSAPPRTIKVRPEGDPLDQMNSSDDDSSCDSSSDESEGISSSDHDTDSSDGDEEEEDIMGGSGSASGSAYMSYMRRPAKRQCRRGAAADAMAEHKPPFVPLPPLRRSESAESSSSEESETESDDSTLTTAPTPEPPRGIRGRRDRSRSRSPLAGLTEPESDRPPSPTQLIADPPVHPPPLPLSPLMRPIDLTTDHSAYNPAEVTAVLRRCNNAPRAISSASGGGIKRVAGSLAVTRALGDAYLKTPRLSFFPYKRHAPYITARPEVNCRILTKGGDRVLILASDGVWERASGDDVLRWVRNYYNERIAGTKHHYSHHKRSRRSRRRGRRHHHHHRHHHNEDDSDCNLEHRPLALPSSTMNNQKEEREGAPTAGTASTSSDGNLSGRKRKRGCAASVATHSSNDTSRRSRNRDSVSSVSDIIVRRVLNKVRRARNISSMRELMSLPKGRARRSKHDDITASVVDMSGFVS